MKKFIYLKLITDRKIEAINMTKTRKLSSFGRHYNGDNIEHGSFHMLIFKAFFAADLDNKMRLIDAFPEWFNEDDLTFNYNEPNNE